MYRYQKENWVQKVRDSYPKTWSTTYGDMGLQTDRHLVHDLGHDPHYVYDRPPALYYRSQVDGRLRPHYEKPTTATEARSMAVRSAASQREDVAVDGRRSGSESGDGGNSSRLRDDEGLGGEDPSRSYRQLTPRNRVENGRLSTAALAVPNSLDKVQQHDNFVCFLVSLWCRRSS